MSFKIYHANPLTSGSSRFFFFFFELLTSSGSGVGVGSSSFLFLSSSLRPLRVQTTFSYQRNPSSYFNRYSPYPQGGNEVSVQQLNSSAPIQNKYLNKLYCSLCGKNTHTASQGCYAIKRNGTVVPCPPHTNTMSHM